MSLIVENGTGLANAESYCTIGAADNYHAARGNEIAWGDLDDEVKEQCLRRAAEFLQQVYRSKWAGVRVSGTQALDWPRYNVCVDGYPVASSIVPVPVQRACMELALRAKDGPLLPDQDTGSNQIKKDKTGPLETEYFQANVDAKARFVAIDAMLQPYFGSAGGSNSIRLVRG